MKEKVKEILKDYLVGFLLSMFLTTSVSVYAVTFASDDITYDNTQSGLKSTNVRNAIDELYSVCSN